MTIYGTAQQIRGTLCMLRRYHRFLDSDADHMVDPGGRRMSLTKGEVRDRLAFLLNHAIQRKSNAWPMGVSWSPLTGDRHRRPRFGITFLTGGYAPLNHLGTPFRNFDPDIQRALLQDAQRANTPRLIVRQWNSPHARRRLQHRLTIEG